MGEIRPKKCEPRQLTKDQLDDVLEVAVNGEALEWASAERLSGGESHAPLGFAELSIR